MVLLSSDLNQLMPMMDADFLTIFVWHDSEFLKNKIFHDEIEISVGFENESHKAIFILKYGHLLPSYSTPF